MDLKAVAEILDDAPIRAVFQAAVLVIHEHTDITAQELADQLGISRATLYRWITRQRQRREREPRLYALAINQADAAPDCDHRALWTKSGRRICIRCLISNFEKHPALRRYKRDEPKPEPTKVYRPGLLRGGRG